MREGIEEPEDGDEEVEEEDVSDEHKHRQHNNRQPIVTDLRVKHFRFRSVVVASLHFHLST